MRVSAALALAVFTALIPAASFARGQSLSRVSVDSAGVQGNLGSRSVSISADGRYTAFLSDASNLVSGDTNRAFDVFVHDAVTGETRRVSVDSAGGQANARSDWPFISADGRFVAFQSSASNLVPGDSNASDDVFVHDGATGETVRVSVDSSGVEGDSISQTPSISADGRFVAFASSATNLVPGDTNGNFDVFVHDRSTGETSLVSVSPSGFPGNADSYGFPPVISADGRHVAFHGRASNLVPSGGNGFRHVFVHDRSTGATSRVSVDSGGLMANGNCDTPSISADGRYVTFTSEANSLAPGDANGVNDAFVHDRQTGVTSPVSVDSTGALGDRASLDVSVSPDGRFVAFESYATNLVAGDTNGRWDVFLHDRERRETSRLSVSMDGVEGNMDSLDPVISADGRYFAFESVSTNLVFDDTNDRRDVFVRLLADCRKGNVNGGAGEVADVLFVNDSAGGAERIVRTFTYVPFSIFMGTPPSATGVAPFVLYAWSALPTPGTRPVTLPFGLGDACFPMPFMGGNPSPRVVWNNTGSLLPGAATHPSSPAPSFLVRRPAGFGRPASAYLQGLIRDGAAPNGRAAVTNGVTIEIR